jgi:murein L,D-transpeptidase YcbB/YkuD
MGRIHHVAGRRYLLRLAGASVLALAGPDAMSAPADEAGTLHWFDTSGRPHADARQAVGLLQAAGDDGLTPADYGANTLARALDRATHEGSPDLIAVAALDRALDQALQQLLVDLHRGRVDPRRLALDFEPVAADGFDAATLLQTARSTGRLADAVRTAAPALPQYAALRTMLARYRALADHPAWQQPLPALPAARGRTPSLAPGGDWPGVAQLAERLIALGDLAESDRPAPGTTRYDGTLVAALQAFQQRHGLGGDGVIGAATLARLQVTPAARARQIGLMLERLRWTPLFQGPRMIVVNLPEFVLRAYEVDAAQRIQVRREMRVIVGKALDTRTPLFDEAMRAVEFSPYWNVPPSIARGELIPQLRRAPGVWSRDGYEFVRADGSVQTTLDAEGLAAVQAGRWRIRQRPGARNALGDIKFVFPNRDHIYLHHTPSVGLFARDRRDLSHGCIRVEDPFALATFVLQGDPDWPAARIRDAMAAGESRSVRLRAPIPVLIAYGTTLVKADRIHFFDDIYGLDGVLDAALRQRSAALATATAVPR